MMVVGGDWKLLLVMYVFVYVCVCVCVCACVCVRVDVGVARWEDNHGRKLWWWEKTIDYFNMYKSLYKFQVYK